MTSRPLRALPYVAIAVIGCVYAYLQLHSQWQPYDDEGYLLLSLREFVSGKPLYEYVFSQYGPFYYELFGGLFALTGVEPTNDAGRLIVTFIWVATATALGLLAQRVTDRAWIGWLTAALAMALTFLKSEPMHPVGLATVLTIAILALLPWRPGGLGARWALALGAACAALGLVKVNQGLLAIVAIVAAGLLMSGDRRLRGLAAVGLLACAPVLMAAHLDDPRVTRLALTVAALLAATVIVTWQDDTPVRVGSWPVMIAAGGGLLAAAVCIAILVNGTSLDELVEGAFLAPGRHPETTFAPLKLPWSGVVVAFAGLGLAGATATGLLRPPPTARVVARAFAAAAIVVAAISVQGSTITETNLELPVFAATAWLAARAPYPVSGEARLARLAAVLFAATGLLQVYPVAGTQRMATAIPMLLLAALLLNDAIRIAETRERRFPTWATAAGASAFAACCLAANGVSHPVQRVTGAYRDKEPIGLHGAENLRVGHQQARAYRGIAEAARACDPLVTYPGMNSFYIWTRKRPPTGLNTTSWMTLLDVGQQQRIVDAIAGRPRLCVLRNQSVERGWLELSGRDEREIFARPLARYLLSTPLKAVPLAPEARRAGFKLLVRASPSRSQTAKAAR